MCSNVFAQTINEIQFKNLSKISENIANDALTINKGDKLDNKKINESLKKFFSFGYFDDIKVEYDNEILTFTFKEKPAIAKIDIKGYKTSQDDIEYLYSVMGIKKGSMYTLARIEKAKQALLAELNRDGYINSVVEVDTKKLNESSLSVTFSVNKGDEIIIKKVNYFGAKNLEDSDFEAVTANKEEEFAPWFFGQNDGEVKIDQLQYEHLRIKEAYMENGYLDANIKEPFLKVDFNTNYAELDFYIDEGKQYKVKDIKIYLDASIYDPKKIYPELKLKNKKMFNIKKLRSDVDLIKTIIADKGYAFVDVRFDIQKDKENATASIVYNVIPGEKVYINDVLISGNSRTLDRVIRRDVFLAPGDLYSETDFKDSKFALRRTGFFEEVVIEKKKVSIDKVDLLVSVKETPTGSFMIGAGYGSYDGFMLSGSVSDKNIFGSGLNLGFSVDLSNKKSNFEISLSNPAIYDSKYSGRFNIHDKEREYTDYDLHSRGFGVGIGKSLTRHIRAGVNYALDDIDKKYKDNTVGTNEAYMKSSITPYISYNDTDDYFLPREGIDAGTSLEYAGIGGDIEYIKSSTSFKFYYGLEDIIDYDWIFRYRANLNYLIDNGTVKEGDSFYLGGPKTLRGYETLAFGPDGDDNIMKKMFSNGIEMSFPLIPSAKMRWELFIDYGMIGEDSFTDVKRAGAGAAISWTSPFGPIQFIFSEPLNAEASDKTSNFEFSMGSKF